MALLTPPSPDVLEVEPPRPARPRPPTPWRAYLLVVLSLALAALANAPELVRTAQRQPLGWRRDVLVDITDVVADVADRTRLDRPRIWIEHALDREASPAPRPLPVAPTVPVTTAPVTTAPVTATAPMSSAPGASVPSTTAGPSHRRPTAADPLRVWIVGDSMMQVVGQSLVNGMSPDDAIRAQLDYRVSTGLTRPDYFDWPARLAELVGADDPDVVIVMFGANDAQGIVTAHGPEPFGTDGWLAEYRVRVDATMDLLTSRGAVVYWIGQPVMRSERFSARMAALDEVYRSAAEGRPDVVYVDSWPVFAVDGAYSAYLDLGGPTLVRQSDGIHLTRAGGDRLAGVVLDRLHQDWFEEER